MSAPMEKRADHLCEIATSYATFETVQLLPDSPPK